MDLSVGPEAVLRDLAGSNEDLIEYAASHAPLHSRLVAGLQALLFEP